MGFVLLVCCVWACFSMLIYKYIYYFTIITAQRDWYQLVKPLKNQGFTPLVTNLLVVLTILL